MASTGVSATRRRPVRWAISWSRRSWKATTRAGGSQPLWGYRFRVLTAQGSAAKGGARSYIVNGEMSGGFALIAYPAEYGRSGIMTFIVNQDGVVYQKDLGEDTLNVAAGLEAYEPDATWAAVKQ